MASPSTANSSTAKHSASKRPAVAGEPAPKRLCGRCENCGHRLHGPFCSQCGQDARSHSASLRSLVTRNVGSVLSLDFRLPRTLAALASPGVLTCTYLSGKRAPYVPPLRLALSLGLVLLLVISLRAPESAGTVTRSSSPAEDLGLLARSYATPLVAGTLLTLPALAGLLKLAFRSAGRPYLEHLVFVLHFHAFATLSMLAVVLSSFVLEADGAVMNALVLCALAGIGVHLLLALRRVHEASWLRAGVAWFFLMFAYGAMNLLVVIGAALSLMEGS